MSNAENITEVPFNAIAIRELPDGFVVAGTVDPQVVGVGRTVDEAVKEIERLLNPDTKDPAQKPCIYNPRDLY